METSQRTPLEELPVNVRRQRQPKKRPGPRPKPLRVRAAPKRAEPIKQIQRTYSRDRKIEVLCFLEHYKVHDLRHQIVTSKLRVREGGTISERDQYGQLYRQPTYEEASTFWRIPISTIRNW